MVASREQKVGVQVDRAVARWKHKRIKQTGQWSWSKVAQTGKIKQDNSKMQTGTKQKQEQRKTVDEIEEQCRGRLESNMKKTQEGERDLR